MITTIIFDLGGVYLYGASGAGKHLEKELGVKVTDDDFLISELNELFLGKMTEEDYWKLVIQNNLWRITTEDLKKAIRKNFGEVKGMRQIVKSMKKNGYKLALLSNHVQEWAMYTELKFKYQNLFHKIFYSYQLGFSKPDKEIFYEVIKQLKTDPKEILFIDDYIKNIEVANELGMNAIHFTSARDLKRHLHELKII